MFSRRVSDDALAESAWVLDSAKARLSIFPYFFRRWDIQPVKHNPKKISGSYSGILLTESHVSLIILRKNLNRFQFLSHTHKCNTWLYKPLTARYESAPIFKNSKKLETIQKNNQQTNEAKRSNALSRNDADPINYLYYTRQNEGIYFPLL